MGARLWFKSLEMCTHLRLHTDVREAWPVRQMEPARFTFCVIHCHLLCGFRTANQAPVCGRLLGPGKALNFTS